MASSGRQPQRASSKQATLFPITGRQEQGSPSQQDACEVIAIGKRRDGGTRYWCLRHKADATAKYGKRSNRCRAAHIPPISEHEIFSLDIDKYDGGVGLWGAVPPVYDTTVMPMDRGVHVHARRSAGAGKDIDQTFARAVRLVSTRLDVGGIIISDLDAIYYMISSAFGYTVRDVSCTHCGDSHLDRDFFSVHPHQRHLCAGCGRHFADTQTGIGNPIAALRATWRDSSRNPVLSKRKLEIRQSDFPGGIQIWGSNPAFLWTAERAEENGIHVHAFRKLNSLVPDLDETYGDIAIDGVRLDAANVRLLMAQKVLPSVRSRVRSLECPKCRTPIYATGEAAYSPAVDQKCNSCSHRFTARGRVRKIVANPLLAELAQLSRNAPRKPQEHDLELLPESI
jgi:hypothetical protein